VFLFKIEIIEKGMKDIVKRFPEKPLLFPSDILPSHKDLQIACILNTGVFQFDGKIWMILRVAERLEQKEGTISFSILTDKGIEVVEISKNDPELDSTDVRV
jgi:predicted GH43/DUF377 family glycosyl hydrolase